MFFDSIPISRLISLGRSLSFSLVYHCAIGSPQLAVRNYMGSGNARGGLFVAFVASAHSVHEVLLVTSW